MIEMNMGTIVAVLGVIGSVLSVYGQLRQMKQNQEEAVRHQVEQQKNLEARLDSLEKAVASHNSYAEKFASLTETIIAMKTDLSWIKNSLEK